MDIAWPAANHRAGVKGQENQSRSKDRYSSLLSGSSRLQTMLMTTVEHVLVKLALHWSYTFRYH
jgi:hypothetical protein